jgi:4,5-DOPA dioxygenase extradiol
LREEGVLILGSGNVVHNLRRVDFGSRDGYEWAVRFNDELKTRIRTRDHAALVSYDSLGPESRLAVPTPEHYLPLLYVLALQGEDEEAAFFNDEAVLGSISMTSIRIGR